MKLKQEDIEKEADGFFATVSVKTAKVSKGGNLMSEMSQAMTRQGITYMSDDSAVRKLLRAAFKAGWEEREVLMNKRASAIELAATMAERKRIARLAENYSAELADKIRRGV